MGALCWWIGVGHFLLAWAPAALLAGSAGIWLFYVQHQFEDAYWQSSDQWSYADAALRGSSYLKLPAILQFFSGNIGLHHIHHLSARIPNYNLQRAHDENEIFHGVPVLSSGRRPARGAPEAVRRGQRADGHLRRGARAQSRRRGHLDARRRGWTSGTRLPRLRPPRARSRARLFDHACAPVSDS